MRERGGGKKMRREREERGLPCPKICTQSDPVPR